ncbi:MAG TPA: maleylpyruvate isomerase family mycothiol-dependent enzyme [Acidimicrobiia bacterium]|nr:maleylpyruvate isomerase family mycothiol-dependent enzyme [Acidimicrobiia bacterium]
METVLAALTEQHTELDALLSPLDHKGWARPTRCEGWDVADVVLHLAQTDELAIASAELRVNEQLGSLGGPEHDNTVDEGAADMVALERGRPHAALLLRWRDGASLLRAVLGASDPHQRVQWVAGKLSIHTLCATRLSECWIHTGDVAGALGVEQEVTDRLEHVARLAWRTLPYAFARAGRELQGPVEFDLRAPSGARWHFVPEGEPVTRVEGDGAELCLVAARRVTPDETSLRATGPDADAVLECVRTYA